MVFTLFSFVFWWPKPEEPPVKEAEVPKEIRTERQEQGPVAATPQSKVEQKQQKPIPTQPALSVGKPFRDHLEIGGQGPWMVVISAGSFRMGDVQDGGATSEVPVRTVNIQKRFAIGRFEVTFEEYDQFVKSTGRQSPDDRDLGRGRLPVFKVSWHEAVEYAKWLSLQTGKRYRLPSEAEWEYAARGGKETVYWWG